ncbi:MAG: aminotransferase [Candidatus Dactylopiibacterium carminicum]|uniref:Aminotransferase n=1 Tax=Candidatus Dactylopiibacterium carminicum TaxID=857335 RepID=A0A272EMV8_9RHOO|nr:pyridoxal phosphate-dependent aminotransferase [Candidatus Dactylopiibacterium carminicum]KAF7597864.1 aminotransferase [Candidatus Dactylopiibacterium carminicum]PAS91457.1 MAG: aminotransferase [Candidatus Dactylopiibacterium carminicum]PAS92837.1 MAG: aminotransferase [Candidatus Dactylopiibacterium carminicum]PAS95785.1 MAG: aminotransferase [Candidatus Dactylopiibacterium carminicum]
MPDKIFPAGPIARRADGIPPFHVMELLSRAHELAAQGRDIIHMEVGEPDFPVAAPVLAAAQAFLGAGRVEYTPAAGLPALREGIAAHYAARFGVTVDPARILVTAGASGALLLALAGLTEFGDRWLLPDPGYPCNRQFVQAFGGEVDSLNVRAEEAFQPTAASVAGAWQARTRGLMVASPANPTGTLIARETLAGILAEVRARNGACVVDEIYQGLTYGRAPETALSLGDDMFVINSFSKYFGLTGWRLGWLVAPAPYVRALEKLAQHYTICASTVAQHAALAAFSPEALAIFEARREAFSQRRTCLLAGLRELGFGVPAEPEGAFYVYADVSRHAPDSAAFAHRLLEETGVAATPGVDFGAREPQRWLRFAYTTDVARIEEALARMKKLL